MRFSILALFVGWLDLLSYRGTIDFNTWLHVGVMSIVEEADRILFEFGYLTVA